MIAALALLSACGSTNSGTAGADAPTTSTPATTATTEVTGPHGGAPMPLTFEQVDGTWVIADESACSMLSMGRLGCH
ncbi:hypothetical protein [Rhodococcus chondri]|uniref:hypothetical protein n=1 Tax=Rhodococcus chondri TaxID=3065941 RepID=UPI0038B4C977